MGSHDWILFATATLALNLTPGPDMLYVSARSIAQGRRAGILSALGVAGGCCVHTLLVAFGLAGLLARFPAAYDTLRYAGAVYLIYLGIRMLVEEVDHSPRGPAVQSGRRVFMQGLITNVLNPKVALFFLAFLPQFAEPARGALAPQILLLGLLFNLSGTLVNLGVAALASSAREITAGGQRAGLWLKRLSATVFVVLGARLALVSGR